MLIKRVGEKRCLRPKPEWHEQPLELLRHLGILALLQGGGSWCCFKLGQEQQLEGSAAHTNLCHAGEFSCPGPVKDECSVPPSLPKAEGCFPSCSSGLVFCWLKSGSGIVWVWYWMNIECASKIKSLFRSSLKYWPWKNFPLLISSSITVSGIGAGLEKELRALQPPPSSYLGGCWDQGWDKTFLSLELRKCQVLTWAVNCK